MVPQLRVASAVEEKSWILPWKEAHHVIAGLVVKSKSEIMEVPRNIYQRFISRSVLKRDMPGS